MSWVEEHVTKKVKESVLDPLLGKDASEAAEEGSRLQVEAGREALETIRGDLQPFRQLGTDILPQFQEFLDPQAQADFAQNNPLLSTLADDVQTRLFANRAARGKLGSGGTAAALQSALVPLGLQQVQQRHQNLLGATQLGQNAAALTGTTSANIIQGIGNVQAGGLIGASNARQQGIQNLFQLAGAAGGVMGGGPAGAGAGM